MAPIVHGLEAEFGDRMNFVYLDIDDPQNNRFKEQLGFRYQPQFFLLDGKGNILTAWIGRVSEDELRSVFSGTLSQ